MHASQLWKWFIHDPYANMFKWASCWPIPPLKNSVPKKLGVLECASFCFSWRSDPSVDTSLGRPRLACNLLQAASLGRAGPVSNASCEKGPCEGSRVILWFGYGSIPINTIFRGMNIHLTAILMFTRGTRFWHTAISGKLSFGDGSKFYCLEIHRVFWQFSIMEHPIFGILWPSLTHGKDGNIQKTIEHYTFADSQSSATITVEADKASCAILGDKHPGISWDSQRFP